MALVYILYSQTLDKYYIGSCLDLEQRLIEHNTHHHKSSFTTRASDWKVYFIIDNLAYDVARKIEQHIKAMKSKKYLENLAKYPDLKAKLLEKYP